MLEVAFEPVHGVFSYGHDAVFSPLPLLDVEDVFFAVEVTQFKSSEFSAANGSRVQGFQDGTISDAEWVAQVRNTEQGLDFIGFEGWFGQSLFRAWEFDFRGGVGGDVIAFGEPFEVVLNGTEAASLRVDGERFVVGFPVVVERSLVALEDGLGDVRGLSEVPSVCPFEEGFENESSTFNRALGVMLEFEMSKVEFDQGSETAFFALGHGLKRLPSPFVLAAIAEVLGVLIAFVSCHGVLLL